MIEFIAGKSTFTSPQKTHEGNAMEKHTQLDTDTWKYAEQSMKWFGWGSPVGLGLFFISLSACAVLLHMAGIWH